MIDLGDPVVLTFLVKDADGNPVAAGAAVATVTLPDGTSSTPAVTNPTLGTYKATFATTQAGRHEIRWVATGANAQAYTDVFNVAAAAPGLIISLDEARNAIGFAAAATARDEDVRGYIAAASVVIEDLVGTVVRRTCDEWYDGGAGTVRLLHPPVLSITSVTESFGSSVRTLTEQPLDGGGFGSFGYTVDLDDGILQRRVAGQIGVFQPGRRNVGVVYVAGRTVVPENVTKATRRLVKHLWDQEQTPGRPDLGGADGVAMTTTPSGFAVPRAVIELCADSLRIIGIG